MARKKKNKSLITTLIIAALTVSAYVIGRSVWKLLELEFPNPTTTLIIGIVSFIIITQFIRINKIKITSR